MILLACALVALFVANQFIELTDDVQEGETRHFDRWAVREVLSALGSDAIVRAPLT